MAFGFVKKIAKTAGKVAIAPIKVQVKVTGQIAKGASKIPVVGKPLSAVIKLGNAPVDLVNKVTSGERIDKAVLNNIRSQVKQVKEVAPYAKMVVSLVPGVGTAVAAGIAAGAALAEGQPITAALIAGVKGAIPGGPLAQAAFSVSTDVISGKPIQNSLVNALPLNQIQKDALKTTVSLGKDLAAGKNVNKSVLAAAQSKLPKEVQVAINIGASIGFAQTHQKKSVAAAKSALSTAMAAKKVNTQFKPSKPIFNPVSKLPPKMQAQFSVPKRATANGPNPSQLMRDNGKKLVDTNPVLKAGLSTLKIENDRNGYFAAVGLMANTATEAEISKFHALLTKTWEKGFNIGCAAVIGLKHITKTGNNIKDFGAAVAYGLNGATTALKVAAVTTIGEHPEAKDGILEVAATKKVSWLRKLLIKLHFVKDTQVAA